MLPAEIKKTIRTLSRTEKLQLIQFITIELLTDERSRHFGRGDTHGLWSAHNEEAAAGQLAKLLENES